MIASSYVVVIEGEIDQACALVFAPAEVATGAGRTTLRTAPIDQPALHGIIQRVAGLGLTLLSVTSADLAADSERRSPPTT